MPRLLRVHCAQLRLACWPQANQHQDHSKFTTWSFNQLAVMHNADNAVCSPQAPLDATLSEHQERLNNLAAWLAEKAKQLGTEPEP